MKISEIFGLNKSQYELDFVDIDIETDHPLFLDPFFISTRVDPWSVNADRTIKSFFQFVIDLIKSGNISGARSIFTHLNEPNETCLGISRDKPRGNGMGDDNATQIFNSILSSKAVETGLVEDLQDSAIFIEGIGRDKVSDATTNIIRRNLIEYTKNQCDLWGIPLTKNAPSLFFWDQNLKRWSQAHVERLIIKNRLFLLVPKISVTFYKDYVDQQYYQHYLLNFLQDEHLANNSALVQYRKAKKNTPPEPYVTKKDIMEKDTPFSKELLRDFTKRHPDVFKDFKSNKSKQVIPINNANLTEVSLKEIIEHLTETLENIRTGGEDAQKYHKLMTGILELIFYPNLVNPIKEREINEGRKRIDIVFDNSAKKGFFNELHTTKEITSLYIMIECKNYEDDPNNPELDQLSGRLSVNRGKFGLLTCRTINNKDVIKKRCIDYWKDKKELLITLDDNEIISMLKALLTPGQDPEALLYDKQREIILS